MYKNILVPVDGSELSTLALREAIKLAESQGSRLKLVHVVDELVFMPMESPAVHAVNVIASLRGAGKKVLEGTHVARA